LSRDRTAAGRFFIVYELSREARQRGVADLTRWTTDGRLRHAIGATFPLDAVVEAHELVESGRAVGDVVVEP
jgi:NADPH2:quinone reductase